MNTVNNCKFCDDDGKDQRGGGEGGANERDRGTSRHHAQWPSTKV